MKFVSLTTAMAFLFGSYIAVGSIAVNAEEASAAPAVEKALDKANLEDGNYTVIGALKKFDKTTDSMANSSIDKNIKLRVENGNYFARVMFKPMEVGGTKGYLGDTSYFLTGYTANQYGKPEGETMLGTVIEYYRDENGEVMGDKDLNMNYPKIVEYPVIPEAKVDGAMPLTFVVPAMEKLVPGYGTQQAYLVLDWATLTKDENIDDSSQNNDEVVKPAVNEEEKPNKDMAEDKAKDDMKGEAKVEMKTDSKETKKASNSPNTSDETNGALALAVMMMAGVGTIAVRKKNN